MLLYVHCDMKPLGIHHEAKLVPHSHELGNGQRVYDTFACLGADISG